VAVDSAVTLRRARSSAPFIRLTRRETRIISLLAAGASTSRVAQDLYISPHTVAAHLSNMLRRAGAANRTELIARLYAGGILAQGAWPPIPAAAEPGGRAVPGPNPHEDAMTTMNFDALEALREAGHPVDVLTAQQRGVLAQLTEEEVRVLNSVKDRLDAAAGEVEGQDLKLL